MAPNDGSIDSPYIDYKTGMVMWDENTPLLIPTHVHKDPPHKTWTPATFFSRGERILGNHGRWMIAECAGITSYGTSGIDEPHWPEMEGSTTLDNSIVWKCEGFPGCQPEWAKVLAAEWTAHLAQGPNYAEDQPIFSMDGKPISQSTKAREATPKFEPPLWEEREV